MYFSTKKELDEFFGKDNNEDKKTKVAHKKKLEAKGTITIQKPETDIIDLDKRLSTNKDNFGEIGVRKLTSDDVDIMKHVYWQLRTVSKLSKRRSLELAGEAVHVSRGTAKDYLFTYPYPKKLENLQAHRREVQKNWRDNIKQDPIKYAQFKQKDKEKRERYYNKVKDDPSWKIKHVNHWRKWYAALKNDGEKYQDFQKYKSESNKIRYEERKAWVDNVSLKLTNLDAEIITLEELCKAIAHKCKSRDYTEFTENAGMVMDLIGYSNRMSDNSLTKKARQLFYTLEESGLFKTDRESELIPQIPDYIWSGFDWQCKFWCFNKKAILQSAIAYEKSFMNRYIPKAERNPLPDIYDKDELWVRPSLEAVV